MSQVRDPSYDFEHRAMHQVPTVTRPGWWTWLDAVRQAVADEGTYATAVVWGQLCWSWRGGDHPDTTRARPIYADDLQAAHPGGIGRRELMYRLAELRAAGLLEQVRASSRRGPAVFAPTLPNVCTGVHSLQDDGCTPVHTKLANGCTPIPEQVHTNASPLFSPENPENPPAGARARGRERARRAGGVTTSDPDGVEAFELLARAMATRWGEGTPRRITEDYRRRAVMQLAWLRRGGWSAHELVDRLNAREWASAGSVGRALLARLRDLADEPPPSTARERHEQRQARDAVRPCDHGTPGGCSACFMCRRGNPDDDGLVCTQCAPTSGDGLSPPGFTPPMFPG